MIQTKREKIEVIVYEKDGEQFLGFKRVSYGKISTPKELREYRLEGRLTSPVGTIVEIKEFMKKCGNDFRGVVLTELDGSQEFIKIEKL